MKRAYVLLVGLLGLGMVAGCARHERVGRADVYVRPADRVTVREPVRVQVDPTYATSVGAALDAAQGAVPVVELRRPAAGAREGLVVDQHGRSWQRIAGSVKPTLELAPVTRPDGSIDHMGGERTGATHLSYPVANGVYTVRMFFTRPAARDVVVSERVFQASVEGQLVDSIDLAQLMVSDGMVETRGVRVTDGRLDILFTAQVRSDVIRVIEVVEER